MSAIRLNIAAPAELIAAVPAIIGFIPTGSVVVIGLRDGHVEVVMRHDAATLDRLADHMAEVAARHGLPTALVIAVTTGDGEHTVRTMTDALTRHGIDVVRRLHTTRCDQPAPYIDYITGETGTTADYRDNIATATRVVTGRTIAATRDDIARQFDTTPAADTSGIEPGSIEPLTAAAEIVRAVKTRTIPHIDALAVQIGALVTRNLAVRDAMLRVAAHDAEAAAWVFTELSRPLRTQQRAEVLTIAAFCHYIAGSGGAAGIAFDRIAAEHGGLTSLAELLDRALRGGIPPHKLAETVIPTAELADELIGGHFPRPDEV